jgi:hypothetical protein
VRHAIPLVEPREGRRFTGAVCLLINRQSYSNAVLVAAIAQDYGFATVIGEETADLASTFGAAEKFTLPGTGIEVSFPKARHPATQWRHGSARRHPRHRHPEPRRDER